MSQDRTSPENLVRESGNYFELRISRLFAYFCLPTLFYDGTLPAEDCKIPPC